MAIVFRREKFRDCYPDIKKMTVEHWEALARNKDTVPLDVNEDLYCAVDDANSLMMMVVRDDDRVVGYIVFIVRHHPHYQTTKWAFADLFWLTPSARKAGVGKRMFQAAETELRAMGARVVNVYFKLAHPQAGPLLESLGYEPIETVYQKVLA